MSTLLELAGFIMLVAAVYLLAGLGWSLLLAGLLVVFVGFAVDGARVSEKA